MTLLIYLTLLTSYPFHRRRRGARGGGLFNICHNGFGDEQGAGHVGSILQGTVGYLGGVYDAYFYHVYVGFVMIIFTPR